MKSPQFMTEIEDDRGLTASFDTRLLCSFSMLTRTNEDLNQFRKSQSLSELGKYQLTIHLVGYEDVQFDNPSYGSMGKPFITFSFQFDTEGKALAAYEKIKADQASATLLK